MFFEQMSMTRTNSFAYSYRADTDANLQLRIPSALWGTREGSVRTIRTYFGLPMGHLNFPVNVGMSATFQWFQAAWLSLLTDVSINKILRRLWVCFMNENSHFIPLNRFIGHQCWGWNESSACDSCPWLFVQIEEVASKAFPVFFVHKIIWGEASNTFK